MKIEDSDSLFQQALAFLRETETGLGLLERDRDRERDTERERKTERQSDRERQTEGERQRDRDRENIL